MFPSLGKLNFITLIFSLGDAETIYFAVSVPKCVKLCLSSHGKGSKPVTFWKWNTIWIRKQVILRNSVIANYKQNLYQQKIIKQTYTMRFNHRRRQCHRCVFVTTMNWLLQMHTIDIRFRCSPRIYTLSDLVCFSLLICRIFAELLSSTRRRLAFVHTADSLPLIDGIWCLQKHKDIRSRWPKID